MGQQVPMHNPDWFDANNIDAFEQSIWKEVFSSDPDTTESKRIQEILDHKYSKADLEQVAKESTHLPHDEQQALLKLLKKYETLFDGTLGNWKMDKYNIELREDATPYHARPYPVPHSQEQQLREEVARLEKLKVLKKINRS